MNRAAPDAFAAQLAIGWRQQPAATDAVDKYAYLDSTSFGIDQGSDKAATPDVVSEDVGRQADAGFCRLDRRQHGRVSRVPVLVNRHLGPCEERTGGNTADPAT